MYACTYMRTCMYKHVRMYMLVHAYKHVRANISRSRYNTPAVWTKWNGARSRRVDAIAGEGSLRRYA